MKQLAKLTLVCAVSAVFFSPLAAQEEAMSAEDGLAAAQQASAGLPGVQPPAAEPPASQPLAVKQEAPLGVAEAEWKFLAAAAQDKEEDVLEMVLPQAEDWLARNPAHADAGDAQLLKADLHYKLGDYKSAVMDLLRHFYEYPQVKSSEAANKLFKEILEKKVDKKLRPGLQLMAGAVEGADAPARLYAMLQKVPGAGGALLYEPMIAEHRGFLNRFPDRPGNDNVRMAVADMHLNMKEYLRARLAYEKMIAMHPDSPLIARAKLFLAVILADNLKEYDKAIKVFQDITVSLPGTEQAAAAYVRLPELAEKQKKYQLAVDVYEEIIKLYPDKQEAYNAYVSEARVLREEMDKFPEAVAVLNRVADKYKDASGVEALLLAAEICRKDMKDTAGEVKMYDRIAAEFKTDPEAPKALMAAGEVYEKAKDYEKARNYYETVKSSYPEDAQAKKAQKRLDGLLAR